MECLLLLVSFAIVLAGALLFTNAVEWLGHRLRLGEGAVGSILAAVGTATPETLIAIVALIGAKRAPKTWRSGRSSARRSCSAPSRWRSSASSPTSTRTPRPGRRLAAHGQTLERDLPVIVAIPACERGR